MFPNDTQEDDFTTSYEELMSLHGDLDDENHKRTIFKIKQGIHMIQNLRLRLI